MKAIVNTLTKQSSNSYVEKANCFNAVQLYFNDTLVQKYVGPEDFVFYIGKYFNQIASHIPSLENDVTIIWSRSAFAIPNGQICINQLIDKKEGYPFGLIIQHAFCTIEQGKVFQKPNTKTSGHYEVVNIDTALAPYLKLKGFELTRHRRI